MPDCTRNPAPREVRGFRGEVGITDVALGVGQVHQRIVQGILVRLERRPLERTTRPRSEVIWLIASSTMLAAFVGSCLGWQYRPNQVGTACRRHHRAWQY